MLGRADRVEGWGGGGGGTRGEERKEGVDEGLLPRMGSRRVCRQRGLWTREQRTVSP